MYYKLLFSLSADGDKCCDDFKYVVEYLGHQDYIYIEVVQDFCYLIATFTT